MTSAAAEEAGDEADSAEQGAGAPARQLSAPSLAHLDSAVMSSPSKLLPGHAAVYESHSLPARSPHADGSAAGEQQLETAMLEDGSAGASWAAFRLIWVPVAALSLSSTIALIIFPFFTFVPTSGLLGESLPRVRCQQQGWRGHCSATALLKAASMARSACACLIRLLLFPPIAGPVLCPHLC